MWFPILLSGISPALASSGTTDPGPTCFPIILTLSNLIRSGRALEGPVMVEEWTSCDGRPLAPVPFEVPPELSGREALEYVVATYRTQVKPEPAYEVVERAGGWLVAPVERDRVLDLRVHVDPEHCPTVAAAERCVFDQIVAQSKVWVGHRPFEDPRDALPNAVTFDGPALEALRAVYQPHELLPIGFALATEPEHRPGRQLGRFELLFDPFALGRIPLENIPTRDESDPDFVSPVLTPAEPAP